MSGPSRGGPSGDRTVVSNYQSLGAAKVRRGLGLDARPHDRTLADRVTGWIELSFTTLEPLHVGSGASTYWDHGDGKRELVRDIVVQLVGDGSMPVIPGSSIKGAVRSVAEALGGGCALECRTAAEACVTCAIFGHLIEQGGFLGRASFDDAHPIDADDANDAVMLERMPQAFPPRISVGRRIYAKTAAQGPGNVPYVVVDGKVAFRTKFHADNLTRSELGLVLLSAGVDGSFRLRVGGARFAACGRVRVEVEGARLRRGYRSPRPEVLARDAAVSVAREAMALSEREVNANGGGIVLDKLRAVLGD